jgi:hypothetical protein
MGNSRVFMFIPLEYPKSEGLLHFSVMVGLPFDSPAGGG